MDRERNTFIQQTADDYDMSYSEVENIKNKHPNEFYDKLEEFIKERSES